MGMEPDDVFIGYRQTFCRVRSAARPATAEVFMTSTINATRARRSGTATGGLAHGSRVVPASCFSSHAPYVAKQIEQTLSGEGRGVHHRPPAQQNAEQPQRRQRIRDGEPRHLVRDELDPRRIAPGQEKRGFEPEQLVVARQRPPLPADLVFRVARGAIVGARPIVEHHAGARQHTPHRRKHVVEDRVLRQRPPERPPHRIHRSRGAHRRGDGGFVATDLLSRTASTTRRLRQSSTASE